MIVSSRLMASLFAFSPKELATIEILPLIGISVVIGGLAILAIILTQFHRLNGVQKKETGPATAPVVPAAASAPVASVAEEESAAVATAIYLYLQETAESVAITETPQDHHSTPWTDFGKQYQQYRFQRWQSSTKAR